MSILYEFKTKEDLIDAYAYYSAFSDFIGAIEQDTAIPKEDIEIKRMVAKSLCKYRAPFYSGGWIIPDFGYSTERIGKYVSKEKAGNPSIVAREDFNPSNKEV